MSIQFPLIHFTLEEPTFVKGYSDTNAQCIFVQERCLGSFGSHVLRRKAGKVGRFVREEKKIPYLHVETDYSQSDIGQLNTRIAALIEML